MGNHSSKVIPFVEVAREDKPIEGSLPSTPIHAPIARKPDLDPRSPSANILRTPIQIGVDLNVSQTPTIGEINTADCVGLDEKSRIVTIDPRSPTVEFTRTPIVLENKPVKLRNKNLDNVRQQLLEYSPVKINKESPNVDRTSKQIQGPILLDSTPIKRKPSQKRKSTVGLLETNLDYIETDLNVLPKNTVDTNVLETPKVKCDVLADPRSPSVDFLRTPIVKTDENSDVSEVVTEVAALKLDVVENDEVLENVDEVVCVDIENESQITAVVVEPSVEHHKTFDESITSPIKETLERMCKLGNDIKDVIAITQDPIVIDDRNFTNEFDKKVTDLIYEDAETNTLPRARKSRAYVRTPLGAYNTNTQPRKSVSKLKVSDKPMTRGEFALSKIPVFKEKKSKGRMSVGCENTPPRSMSLNQKYKQPKKAEWDTDKTLII